MPALTIIRDAAVALLAVALPHIKKIEAFSGELSLEAAALKNLPYEAVFVAAPGAHNAGESLDFDLLGQFAAFALARGRRTGEDRDMDALALAEAAAVALHGGTFGLGGVGPARVVSILPVNHDDLTKRAIRVWAVTWLQPLTLT